MVFQDEEIAQRCKERIEAFTNLDLDDFVSAAFADCPDPDLALINLERWLHATSNPRTYLAHLIESPKLAKLLIDLLGAGQSMADALIQNPELAGIVTDPAEIAELPNTRSVLAEGQSLLQNATSYLHKLDRLRYLKQRWRLPIVINDLAGAVSPEKVWKAISDVADAIIELCFKTVWAEYAEQKSLHAQCPVMVVAFGKLGGGELNYSSDIDLVYVLDDGADDRMERHAVRFCEMFSRALADSMGRGSLYRVDLRLRPFGSSGPVAPTMRAVETYYRSHAELWEAQALIRSRPICGLATYWPRWQRLVDENCFKKYMSDFLLSSILDTRDRIEGIASGDDLKRGPGGIRDIEFLTQVLQMTHGYGHPEVRVPATLRALRVLASKSFLEREDADALEEAYIMLRQMEHRCQFVDDRQTHSIPQSPPAREHLAKLMGFQHWKRLEAELSFQRSRTRSIYRAVLRGRDTESTAREEVLQRMGPLQGSLVGSWFDSLPESSEFYRSLLENKGSLDRVLEISLKAPRLIPQFAGSLSVTEAIVSGEVEEPLTIMLPAYKVADPQEFATRANDLWLYTVSAWVLDPETNLGAKLASLYDAIVQKVAEEVGGKFDAIALGSYGCLDASVCSDLDLLLLVPDNVAQASAEQEAQEFLAAMNRLKRFGWTAQADLRLRPEGSKGLLVRSHSGLKTYELERMEIWERFALGMARPVFGNPSSFEMALTAAYAVPLTPEYLQELVAMKRRIETERVLPQHFKRDVKLGLGSLSDIDWLVHLYEMRYPTALEVGRHITIQDRVRRMAQVELINAIERDELIQARHHLLRVRNSLFLLGFKSDILPENPDKLERLADACGKPSGYEFLREHEAIIETVRVIYQEGLERLGV